MRALGKAILKAIKNLAARIDTAIDGEISKVREKIVARVDSSYIRSLIYESASHALTVIFRDGCIVRYASVHPNTYKAIINADSIGTKFTELVKDHKFVVVKAAT